LSKTLHGTVHGRTIKLDEDLGIADGQEVEVEVKVVPPTLPTKPSLSEGQKKIYEILGERYDSGFTDTAERHNEHRP